MIESFLYDKVRVIFRLIPTREQETAMRQLVSFILSTSSKKIFLLRGFAGTGKSSMMGSVVQALNELKQKMVLLTPTGRAAKVFASYSHCQAFTIHRKIYRQKSMFSNFFSISDNLHKNTLFLVDEASMIANDAQDQIQFGSGCLLDDLIQYVYSSEGCKLVLIGDSAQLPPVGQVVSPALDVQHLEGYGLNVEQALLTEVVRQANTSGILEIASYLRRKIVREEVHQYPSFSAYLSKDVIRLQPEDLIETLSSCYSRDGIEETLVICRSNKNANIYNKGIRGRILYKEEEIESGDRLMIARNNYFWRENPEKESFIANGDIVELKRVKNQMEMYGFHFADVSLRFVDYEMELDARIILETLQTEAPALTSEMRQALYEAIYADYALQYHTKKEIYDAMKKDPWLNALQVKYAYALTCHKSQGGQWKNVFVDQGYLTEDMLGMDYFRWLYTAFSRATERLFLLRFKE